MPSNSLSEARIRFIETYSEIEAAMSNLIQALLDVDSRIAWSIFYRVSSTRSSYAMILDFIKVKHPELKKAWCVIERWLTPIDTARNHIVHWMVINKDTQFLANPATYIDLETLKPEEQDTEQKYTKEQIDELWYSAFKASAVVSMLARGISEKDDALLDRFLPLTNDQTPVSYTHLTLPTIYSV